MTEERFLTSRQSVLDVRAFLYFSIALRELYSGDGYTWSEKGLRGPTEYVMPNAKLSTIVHRSLELPIELLPTS